MRIAIITHSRSDIISTPAFFSKTAHEIHVIVNPPEQLPAYQQNTVCQGVTWHTCEPGIVAARNYVLEHVAKQNEWTVCLDDNITGFTWLEQGKEITITGEQFLTIIQRDLNKCDNHNIRLYGTAIIDNIFFRKKKYVLTGLIQHKAYAIKPWGATYDTNILSGREEYEMTARALLEQGMVLRNNYLFAKRKHFQKGGIGTKKDRTPGYKSDAQYLLQKYPGLLRQQDKKNDEPGTGLQFNFHNLNSLQRWRETIMRNNIVPTIPPTNI